MSGERTQGRQAGVPDTPDRPIGISTVSGPLVEVGHRPGAVYVRFPGIHTREVTLAGARELLQVLPGLIAAAEAAEEDCSPVADVVRLGRRRC